MYSGGENCDYEWFVLDDSEFNVWYDIYKTEINTEEADLVGGFTVASERLVFIRDADDWEQVGGHEALHVICNLEFLAGTIDETELGLCHFMVDLEYLAPSRPDNYDDWGGVTDNTPPKFSAKIEYSRQFR